jgi:hypothetical protein
MRRSCLLLLLLVSSVCLAADDVYENEKSDELRPYRLPGVEYFTENKNHNAMEMCLKFRLNQAEIRHFFRDAQRISRNEYVHDFGDSPCYTSGKIRFINETWAKWEIDRIGRGVITLSGKRKLYFYCAQCKAKAFDGAYENEKHDEPRPYTLGEIKSLTIKTHKDEIPTECSNVILTESDVNVFFKKAQQISKKEYLNDIDNSSCTTLGEITFTNNSRAQWEIDQLGRGKMMLPDKSHLYFYCSHC